MTKWTREDLAQLDAAKMLNLSAALPDGSIPKAVSIWVVRAGNDVYVRSYRGPEGRWYQAAADSLRGRITSGGVMKDVKFELISNTRTNAAVDAAFAAKYRSYQGSYLEPMIGDQARAATVRLVPID